MELKTFLIQSGKIENANIYSFEPYANCQKPIISLTEEELSSNNELEFDIIMTRWVLHHISSQKRWNIFVHAINKLKKNGIAIILEHGFIDQKYEIQL